MNQSFMATKKIDEDRTTGDPTKFS